MIKYNPKTWFIHIFNFRKSDTFIILWKELVLIALFTLGLTYLEIHFMSNHEMLKGLMSVYSLVGFVISLLLVFRTNTAYERWWEGRKKWGELVNNSRNLAIKISTMLSNPADKLFFNRMISNYAFGMKEHLRDGLRLEELDLTEEEKLEIANYVHKPNYIIQKMYARIQAIKENGEITQVEYLAIDTNLKTFSDIIGACERIKNTPIPFSYSSFLKKFIFIYVVTLPLAFVSTFGYYSAIIATFVFYVLVSMEILAEEIEDPFGVDENDLPTQELCVKIKSNVTEILRF
ncbi:hypothetical protein DNU06_16755 [Putridiphycobacter roseus]|uniref:Bestrophin n=1 Tax=Putridiphycobacter roseus TaxID=2219161 RepID=A0A2W1N8X0_9FLAO|nr:bestrophin family ion channel [Putridiphycobacter roseus]PZE15695.1 hypothetical protein DNU06_16755 [Putridiphycobacter roseus]